MKYLVETVTRKFVEVIHPSTLEKYQCIKNKDLELACGDWVDISKEEIDLYTNDNIHPCIKSHLRRKNIFQRATIFKQKLIACNLDTVVVLIAPKPQTPPILIDKLITVAKSQKTNVVLAINKCDLDGFDEFYQKQLEIYENLVERIIPISAKKNINLDLIRNYLKDTSSKLSLIIGVSGVGKSSLLNSLSLDKRLRTGGLSEKGGRGKNTTTESKALCFDQANSQFLFDIPGIMNFGVYHLTEQEINNGFPDIEEYSLKCKFTDCRHSHENNCAVKEALKEGSINESRVESYRKILNEVKVNEWEIK